MSADDREALRRIADEQTALHRIARLTARACEPDEIFAVVAEEARRVLGAETASLSRIDRPANRAQVIAAVGGEQVSGPPIGTVLALDGHTLTGEMLEARHAARADTELLEPGQLRDRLAQTGIRTAVIAPIIVDGGIWGSLGCGWREYEPVGGIEENVLHFAEAVAAAIREASDREAITALVRTQAALGRVATLAAEGVAAIELFQRIAIEVAQLMGDESSTLVRFEPDGTARALAVATSGAALFREGDLISLEGDSATARVRRSGRPARIDGYHDAEGQIAARQQAVGRNCAAAAPVVVEDRLWGALTVTWAGGHAMPPDAEFRLAEFTELIAVAIASNESGSELAGSRARLLLAGDEARRRIGRDLHDGAQQRLVSLALQLREAQRVARELAPGDGSLQTDFERLTAAVISAGEGLQRTARDLYPPGLERGGLERALRALGRNTPIPLTITLELPGRLPEPFAVVSYQVVREAIEKAGERCGAAAIDVLVQQRDDLLTLRVRHDAGAGAARLDADLVAVRDRVEALGGKLELDVQADGWTTISARFTVTEGGQPASP